MSPEKRKQIDSLEQAIEAALSPGNFIPYNAAWSFVDYVQDVANDIGKIIKKEPERAVNLYETFIALLMIRLIPEYRVSIHPGFVFAAFPG